jgi:hypothetical protein
MAVLIAAAAAPAVASEQFRQSFAQRYSAMTPGVSTGTATILEIFDPGEPRGRPARAVRELTVRFHKGTRFDSSAAPRCTVSRRRLERRGAGACPRASVVGAGSAELRSATRPLESVKVTAFNRRRGPVILMKPKRSRTFTLRSAIDGRRLTTRFPRQCESGSGCAPGEAVLTRYRVTLSSRTANGTRYITTPESCPRSEHWTVDAAVRYSDGYEERRLRSGSPCLRR